MNHLNRDLLVLFKQEFMTPQAIEHEVELLHDLLQQVEITENIAAVCELIDINRCKISRKKNKLVAALAKKELKTFVFINCRN